MIIVEGFNVSLAVHHLSKTCCGKYAEAAKKGEYFQLLSVFQRPLIHSRVVPAAHQAVKIKAGVCCVHVCNFSILASIVLAEALIYKIM
jgi:hypothetical protein